MPQAKLPDINAAWVRYRNYCLQCIREQDYPGSIAAINGINALLPLNYKVEINDEKYNEMLRDERKIVCTGCKTELKPEDVKVMNIRKPSITNFTGTVQLEQVWFCKCRHKNRLSETLMRVKEKKKPSYNQVIPEAPTRQLGIVDRTEFHNKMTKWVYLALEELEYQIGKYRAEYVSADEDLGVGSSMMFLEQELSENAD